MTEMTTAPYHHGNLRAGLLAAADERLAVAGGASLSLRELAKSLGVSVAAVYRHFPSKDALLAELAADGFARMVAQWERQLPPLAKVGAEARFQQLGERYVKFGLSSPALYRLMFMHEDLRRFPALQEAARACFEYVLGTAADTVREAGAAPHWALPTANAAWALVHGYVMLALAGRLTYSGKKLDLPASMLPRFLNLPAEALAMPDPPHL